MANDLFGRFSKNCKAKKINHSLDPVEWYCDCKEAQNDEPCKYLFDLSKEFTKEVKDRIDKDLIDMGVSAVRIRREKNDGIEIQYVNPASPIIQDIMTGSKEQFAQMQQQGYDVDMSGHIFGEPKPILVIEHTNFGKFYKASLNSVAITREKLFEILGIKSLQGRRLEYYANNFQDTTNDYQVEVWEMNVD